MTTPIEVSRTPAFLRHLGTVSALTTDQVWATHLIATSICVHKLNHIRGSVTFIDLGKDISQKQGTIVNYAKTTFLKSFHSLFGLFHSLWASREDVLGESKGVPFIQDFVDFSILRCMRYFVGMNSTPCMVCICV